MEQVSIYYGAIKALKQVSLNVLEGEIVTVIGANGAGKTTLLRGISGLLDKREGHILFQGKDITQFNAQSLVALGICHVPEGRHIFPTLNVSDNLIMGAFWRLKHRKCSKRDIQDELAFVFDIFPQLKVRQRQKGGTLSGGEQQMLAIGRGLMSKPKLILLDEPSMGLAPLVVETIFNVLVNLQARGLTILLVEQNAEAAFDVSQRGYVLQNGQVVLAGDCKELINNREVKDIYFGTDGMDWSSQSCVRTD
ncbi:MAG: ABC transporter ATP-binding protein [Candidatus Methanomethylicaceae archaeon]